MANADVQNLVITLHGRGWSQRRVAGELGISRNTVSVILERVDTAREQGHDVLPPSPVKRGSTLDEHEDFVRGRLKKYPDLSAVRIHEDLQERGFAGGYTIVKELVRRLRPQPKKGPLRPMERIPGKQGQQDWSPYTLDFTEAGRQTVQCFSLVLAYSRRQYIDFTERADMYTFTRQHVLAFERFGGVPHEILPDYVPRHIVRAMCPPPICTRDADSGASMRALPRLGTHNDHKDSSQLSSDSSLRQTGLRGNAAEASVGGLHAWSAASLDRRLISA